MGIVDEEHGLSPALDGTERPWRVCPRPENGKSKRRNVSMPAGYRRFEQHRPRRDRRCLLRRKPNGISGTASAARCLARLHRRCAVRILVRLLVLLVAALGHEVACAGPREEVRATYERFVAAQNARDLDGVRALLLDSPQFLWVSDGRS